MAGIKFVVAPVAAALALMAPGAGSSEDTAGLIDRLAEDTGQSRSEVEAVLDALPNAVMAKLGRGEPAILPGIARIDVTRRAARMGRNPGTGESVSIPAATVATCRPVKALREAVAQLPR